MFVENVPVCHMCSEDPCSIPKLEQHAAVLSTPRTAAPILDRAAERISLYEPLNIRSHKAAVGSSTNAFYFERIYPSWFSLLPSNVNANVIPPSYAALQRRSTFPFLNSKKLSNLLPVPLECSDMDAAVQNLPGTLLDYNIHPDSRPRRKTYFNQMRRPAHLGNETELKEMGQLAASHQPSYGRNTLGQSPQTSRPDSMGISLPYVNQSYVLRDHGKEEPGAEPEHLTIDKFQILHSNAPLTCSKQNASLRARLRNGSPLIKELSGFFVTCAGRYILPSRVLRRYDSDVSNTMQFGLPPATYTDRTGIPTSSRTAAYIGKLASATRRCRACSNFTTGSNLMVGVGNGLSEHSQCVQSCGRNLGPESKLCSVCRRRKTITIMPGAWAHKEAPKEATRRGRRFTN